MLERCKTKTGGVTCLNNWTSLDNATIVKSFTDLEDTLVSLYTHAFAST